VTVIGAERQQEKKGVRNNYVIKRFVIFTPPNKIKVIEIKEDEAV